MGEKLVKKAPQSKWFTRNTNIVFFNILSACVLLFCFSFFFFLNLGMFLRDLTSYMFFFPIAMFLGIGFVCFYIVMLIVKLEAKSIGHADRYDLPYRIIYSLTFILITVRSWLGDFMWPYNCLEYCHKSSKVCEELGLACDIHVCHCPVLLMVPVPIIILAMLSGLMTWFTPKIKYNDNPDF